MEGNSTTATTESIPEKCDGYRSVVAWSTATSSATWFVVLVNMVSTMTIGLFELLIG